MKTVRELLHDLANKAQIMVGGREVFSQRQIEQAADDIQTIVIALSTLPLDILNIKVGNGEEKTLHVVCGLRNDGVMPIKKAREIYAPSDDTCKTCKMCLGEHEQ